MKLYQFSTGGDASIEGMSPRASADEVRILNQQYSLDERSRRMVFEPFLFVVPCRFVPVEQKREGFFHSGTLLPGVWKNNKEKRRIL